MSIPYGLHRTREPNKIPMASLSSTTTTRSPPLPPPPTTIACRTSSIRAQSLARPASASETEKLVAVTDERRRRIAKEVEKQKAKEEKERKEMKNRKVASQKAVSVILRREATKAIIDKRRTKKGPINSKKLLPRTVLEALHERVTAQRWESALKVYFFFIYYLFIYYIFGMNVFYCVGFYW